MTRFDQNISTEHGWWKSKYDCIGLDVSELQRRIYQLNQPVIVVRSNHGPALVTGNGCRCFNRSDDADYRYYPILAVASSCSVESSGDVSFCRDWGLRFPIISGSMANGISSVRLVASLARAGMMGFYGAAGQSPDVVESSIDLLRKQCGELPWGINLIHSPQEPYLEERLVDLFIRTGVTRIEASAYMSITRALVRFRVHGIHRDASGAIVTPNAILAKASRIEIASKFFSPPPEPIIRELVSEGFISDDQAHLAAQIPVASDITAEADSGGHTDNRPLVALLPSFQAVGRDCSRKYGYACALRVGAAGGISTPASAAAAFAMGAGWVMVGSIAQASLESGSSDTVRGMLAEVQQAEITMAPAADMFEMGVQLQVLKRGTLFPMRARKLYDLYREYPGLDALPVKERDNLEKTIFRMSMAQVWDETCVFWKSRDPNQIDRADRDAKHKMALMFRWYLGLSSRWANAGVPDRKLDYQVWCGPAMGAFNQWVLGSFLENPDNRQIETMLLNILWGAAVLFRVRSLYCGCPDIPRRVMNVEPQSLENILEFIKKTEVEQ